MAEDETDLLLFPPLRGAWGKRGQSTQVLISGRNARRVVFGALNLKTGQRVFDVSERHRQEDFQAFLDLVRWHYRSWHVALLLDEDSRHTAPDSQLLAEELDMELLWLPKRTPKLNPLDHLWGHAKSKVSANIQRQTIEEHVDRFLLYLEGLSSQEALLLAGVLSDDFWLKKVL